MEIYLVGGAVRDKLLGLTVTERDWVVVGATEDEMLTLGYSRVGKDFPVFLHPITKEEYALARTERKIAAGHQGFACDASPLVTLEEDLMRRDLTINAIAETPEGEYIDPYGGLLDLKHKRIKHVSEAFAEDPLRVLRVCRFYARFDEFIVAPQTFSLMANMVSTNALTELSAERIYTEVDKILQTQQPQRGFSLLDQLGAHEKLMPEVDPKNLNLLEQMALRSTQVAYRFAALSHGCSTDQIEALSVRLRLPRKLTDIASLSAVGFNTWCQLDKLIARDVVNWFQRIDSFRRPERFSELNRYFELLADISGHRNLAPHWQDLKNVIHQVSPASLQASNKQLKGKAFGEALLAARIVAVDEFKNSRKND